MLLNTEMHAAIGSLEALQKAAGEALEGIVHTFWDQVSFENKARKSLPQDDRSANPDHNKPTKLSLQIKRRDNHVYVNWVTQDSRYKKRTQGDRSQPYKTYITKGAKAEGYSDASLIKHMSGWERELVLDTEARLKHARSVMKGVTAMISNLKKLQEQGSNLKID